MYSKLASPLIEDVEGGGGGSQAHSCREEALIVYRREPRRGVEDWGFGSKLELAVLPESAMRSVYLFPTITCGGYMLASYPGLPSQLFFAAVEKSVGKACKQTSRDVCHR